MKNIIKLIICLVFICAFTDIAEAETVWNKIGMDNDTQLFVSPNYEQDKSLFCLSDNNLYLSIDDGYTWSKTNKIPVWHVKFKDDRSLYTLQGNTKENLGIYKFQFSQNTWSKICDAPPNTEAFVVLTNDIILAGKQNEDNSLWRVFRTSDQGLSWNQVNSYNGGYLFETAPDGTIFTRAKERSPGGKSIDYGIRWKELDKSIDFNRFFVTPSYLADNTILAIANTNSIYRSEDKGENWFTSMNGISRNDDFASIAFSPNYDTDRTIYLANERGHIYISRNGAADWNELDIELQQNIKLNNLIVLPSNKILAGTSDGIYELSYVNHQESYRVVNTKIKFLVGKMEYYIDGHKWYMDTAPYNKEGRTFIPIRYLAYALGIDESNISSNNNSSEITIIKDTTLVVLNTNNHLLLINNKPVSMDVKPEIKGGRVMLPARWLAEAFGAEVSWDKLRDTINIEYLQEKIDNN